MKRCPKCNAQYSNDQAICPIDAGILVALDAKDIPANADPMIGKLIADKYRVEKLLGRGGMGAVYEGQHLLLDRKVAIKVLQQNMANDEQAASRFIREAKASARIEHPNAVTIYDFGVLQEGSAYLVMEFIKGLSLRQLLTKKDLLKADQIADWMIQVCSVVEAAHQQGIIHRDLKPENVMLKESPDGSVAVKVVDFGLAKLTSESTADKASAYLTKPGEMLGTPHYMAPEYYEGETIDKRADIYAIGIMMYELFCGDTPFTGTVQSIIGGHLFKDPMPIIKANPTIHPALDEVVQKALKKNRDQRIGSASELAQELRQALQKAREFFFQKTSVQEPIKEEDLSKISGASSSDRRTLMDEETQILKTEKVIQSSRPTVKVSDMEDVLPQSASKLTQQMAFGTMQVGQEFVDSVKEKQAKPPTQEINKKTDKDSDKKENEDLDLVEIDPEDLEPLETDSGSFTSAPTKPQLEKPERLKPELIIPPTAVSPIPFVAPVPNSIPSPTPSPILDTIPNTTPVSLPQVPNTVPVTKPIATQPPMVTNVPPTPIISPTPSPIVSPIVSPIQQSPSLPDSLPKASVNEQKAQTSPKIAPEYESFSEALAAIKMQLVVGSIIVFLLAVMVTLLIIYRLETT
jgi:serine/threonine-protein kinase